MLESDGTGIIVLLACFLVGYLAFAKIFSGARKPAAPRPDARHVQWANRPYTSETGEAAAWYVVLGVDEGSAMEVIRRAYERLQKAYHPDEMAVFGVGLQKLAAAKRLEIEHAYATARQVKRDYGRSWRDD